MKYARKPHLVPAQERELYPLLDAALKLPYGKAIVHETSTSRANYLYRLATGVRYHNAIESLSIYQPDEMLYGHGVYFNLVIDRHPRGLVIAHIKNPPRTLTWDIIECAATKQPIPFTVNPKTAHSRLAKLKERFPEELGSIYIDQERQAFCYAIPTEEELIIVDVDVTPGTATLSVTPEQRAKIKQ
jgi:hypothetical protein